MFSLSIIYVNGHKNTALCSAVLVCNYNMRVYYYQLLLHTHHFKMIAHQILP